MAIFGTMERVPTETPMDIVNLVIRLSQESVSFANALRLDTDIRKLAQAAGIVHAREARAVLRRMPEGAPGEGPWALVPENAWAESDGADFLFNEEHYKQPGFWVNFGGDILLHCWKTEEGVNVELLPSVEVAAQDPIETAHASFEVAREKNREMEAQTDG